MTLGSEALLADLHDLLRPYHNAVAPRSSLRALARATPRKWPHAKALLTGRFPNGQLRTLQRRIKEWRRVMARGLVYGCLDGMEASEKPMLIGADVGA